MGLRLNIGSGQRKFGAGWTNVDCNPRWEPDVLVSGESMPMFADGSAEVVVLHQVYEHFGLGEAAPLLRECHRVLAPGGSLILTTPDLRALVDAWLRGKLTDYLFCVNLYGAYMNDEADRHKWLYTWDMLEESVKKACEWSWVGRFDGWQIPGADIAMPWWSLALEARK